MGTRPTRWWALVCAWALIGCSEDGLRDTLPPGTQVDTFRQVSVAKIDVLFVIDNSASMVEEQENLARNFDRFLNHLTQAKVDFHIGITTTDVMNARGALEHAEGQPAVITSRTPDPLQAFAANVQVGADTGNAREAGLDAARHTLSLRPPDFLRDDAWLFLIFVSDEDDHSQPGLPKYFHRLFSQLKGKGNEGMIKAGAIIGDVPGGCSSPTATAQAGLRYKEFIDLMGGHTGSICSEDFSPILREMGLDAVGLKRKFPLTHVPDLETLEVVVTHACDADTDLLGRVCEKIDRRCGAGGEGALCTVRRGEGEGAHGWEYEAGTKSLIFNGDALPPRGAPIEILYREPQPL